MVCSVPFSSIQNQPMDRWADGPVSIIHKVNVHSLQSNHIHNLNWKQLAQLMEWWNLFKEKPKFACQTFDWMLFCSHPKPIARLIQSIWLSCTFEWIISTSLRCDFLASVRPWWSMLWFNLNAFIVCTKKMENGKWKIVLEMHTKQLDVAIATQFEAIWTNLNRWRAIFNAPPIVRNSCEFN